MSDIQYPGQDPDHSISVAEANKIAWKDRAQDYTAKPWQRQVIQTVTTFLLSHLSWVGVDFVDPSSEFEASNDSPRQVRFLDYACGPGTLTAIFLPHITEAVGVDLSESMVEAYNKRFVDSNISAKAHLGNLVDPANLAPPELIQYVALESFDFAAVGLGFHHFEDPSESVKVLSKLLKPGGVFMIVDLMDERRPGHVGHDTPAFRATHLHAHGITRPHGFTRDQMHEDFYAAGLVDFKMEAVNEKITTEAKDKEGNLLQMERQLFFAVGRKPLSG